MNQELIDAIESLKDSVNKLTAIQTDIFNVDSSHDDLTSLKGRIKDLIESNKELRQTINGLNASINELSDRIRKH